MQWLIVLAVIFAFLALRPGGATDLSEGGRTLKRVSAAEAYTLWDGGRGAGVLDVRTSGECEAGAVTGAVCADALDAGFGEALGRLERKRPWIVYCRSGNRSLAALRAMKALGFERVYEVEGGFAACARAGFPVSPGGR